jgi:8-oxo-dGTP pyrophosphatase MutT (NUDIX family)
MANQLYIVNVEGIIHKDGLWLLVKRSEKENHAAGKWSMVGGKVEDFLNEYNFLQTTLKREIMEEVHIEVEDEMPYIMSSSFVTDTGKNVVDIIFLCRYKSGEVTITNFNELSEAKWMSADEIEKADHIAEFNKVYIRKAVKLLEDFR